MRDLYIKTKELSLLSQNRLIKEVSKGKARGKVQVARINNKYPYLLLILINAITTY
jgi:uncharacterized membrane protein